MGTPSRRQRRPGPGPGPDETRGIANSPSTRLDPRDQEILRAAFEVFTEKGFHGATMLEVANRARASKTTLYARFESKESLFRALVAWGTRQGSDILDAIARDATLDPLTALHRFAAAMLSQMMQPEKLALFRIAVAEGERLPEIGRILSGFTREHGRTLGRLIARRLVQDGLVEINDSDEYGHSFIGLLQGELFTRALLGTIPQPTPAEIESHAHRAMTRLVRAYAPPQPRAKQGGRSSQSQLP